MYTQIHSPKWVAGILSLHSESQSWPQKRGKGEFLYCMLLNWNGNIAWIKKSLLCIWDIFKCFYISNLSLTPHCHRDAAVLHPSFHIILEDKMNNPFQVALFIFFFLKRSLGSCLTQEVAQKAPQFGDLWVDHMNQVVGWRSSIISQGSQIASLGQSW